MPDDHARSAAYPAAVAYIHRHCVAERDLAAAVGIPAAALQALAEAEVVPCATYRIGPQGVWSQITRLGIVDFATAEGFFAPAAIGWLRRAALLAEDTAPADLRGALEAWLAADLATALDAQHDAARAFGWGHLFEGDRCDPILALTEARSCWGDWMDGVWAVCLRRFDGHHLAVKEIERGRIARLTSGCEARALPAADRLALLDAMARLDAVLMPFAPHERADTTPGLFLDRPAAQYGLPWPPPG